MRFYIWYINIALTLARIGKILFKVAVGNAKLGWRIRLVPISKMQMPDLIVDYDMSRKVFSIVQQEEVTNISTRSIEYSSLNYNHSSDKSVDSSNGNDGDAQDSEIRGWRDLSEKYSCEEKEYFSHDGVRIPLTILFSRSAYQKGQSPGLLHGYGAYGEVLEKSWCPDRLSLLDRGWLLAFADVRYSEVHIF